MLGDGEAGFGGVLYRRLVSRFSYFFWVEVDCLFLFARFWSVFYYTSYVLDEGRDVYFGVLVDSEELFRVSVIEMSRDFTVL